jgi:molybdopterin-guanine dinucleotide biosynthesis protein A
MSSTKIYGLVLGGGKSTRMGTDKGLIAYHGMAQREYLYQLLQTVCDNTYISIRGEQAQEFTPDHQLIIDENQYKGPYNGLLSAHNFKPEVAWLVLACDLPLIDGKVLEQLIDMRDPDKMATAFATRESGLPEPLCAIWEPLGLKKSQDYLENGPGTCPRKFLINEDVKLVFPENEEVLWNANFKEDYEKVMLKLSTNP